MSRKPGIYYKYRSEALTAIMGAESISKGGWYIAVARVLPRKTYGWIVIRECVYNGEPAIEIACRDGSMRYAARTYDGDLEEITCSF